MKRSSQQKFWQKTPDSEANKLDLRNEIQEQYGRKAVSWFSWVFDTLDLPYGSRIIELGCGTGTLWQENQARVPAGWKIMLTDREGDMLRSARQNLNRLKREKCFARVDGQAIPFPDQTFDAVLAIGLLDLVPDLQQALGEIWRVLRPSGMLVTTAGGRGHLQEMEDLLRPFLPAETAEVIGGQEDRFGLENGERLLAPYFEEIVRRDYRDRMVFGHTQPVLDYVLSEQEVLWSMSLSSLGDFVHKIKRQIGQEGSISVTVRKGMFIALKKQRPE